MIGVLTWPTYGTWLPSRRRGWIDRHRGRSAASIPEPIRSSAATGERLKWPPARLTEAQGSLIVRDLARIAALRSFELLLVVAAADHVHIVLSCEPDRDIPRLVQLIKGALSRTLTLAAGDEPAASTKGKALLHHKWWTRQYSFVRVCDDDTLERLIRELKAHEGRGAVVWCGAAGAES